MPTAAPRPCSYPGCGRLVRDGIRCPRHPLPPQGGMTAERLQALRAALLARQPLCEICRAHDLAVPASVRGYRVVRAEGDVDDPSNEIALCEDCHLNRAVADAATAWRRFRALR